LTYEDRISYHEKPSRAVFVAQVTVGQESRRCIVKFTDSYGEAAHRLMAEQQIAPALLFCKREAGYSGLFVVVMDFVEDTKQLVTADAFSKLEQAFQRLHSAGLVFGDLRVPNLLIEAKELKLVDFDWSGRAGERRYPLDLNTKLDWPSGVEPGALITADHDRAQLQELKKIFIWNQKSADD